MFPDLRLEMLHGRMPAREKAERMARFAAGEADLLVATSVVEVGVDVPNATVMIVEGAERFGLAQLHQLRGRVGRDRHRAYCLLFEDGIDEEGSQRLQAVASTQSGFDLAELDLRLRGPGGRGRAAPARPPRDARRRPPGRRPRPAGARRRRWPGWTAIPS